MFWKILLAHFLADFVLQPDWMIRSKHKVATLVLHGGIFFVLGLLFLVNSLDWLFVFGLTVLAAVHILIDFLKVRLQPKLSARGATLFLLDQGLHLAAVLAFVLAFDADALVRLGNQIGEALPHTDVFLLLTFAVLIVFGGGYFTASVSVVVKEVVAFSCGVLFEQKSILGRLLEIQGDHCGSAPVSAVA